MRSIQVVIFMFVLLLGTQACDSATPNAYNRTSAGVAQIPEGKFIILCFHDVRDDVQPDIDRDANAINTERLAAFFDWMQAHEWHAVSVDQIIAAHQGGPELPSNPVLLTFDDGLESTYSRVFPLLKAFEYPAVVSLETGWLRRVHGSTTADAPSAEQNADLQADEAEASRSPNLRQPNKVFYNGKERGSEGFLSWGQVKEMQDSGLVEIATHTDDLHHGILANPQGNTEPAAITRLYRRDTQTYETDQEFRQRIRDDLTRSRNIIRDQTGQAPRIVVWPYGAMSPEVASIARSVGLPISFGLNDDDVPSIKNIDRPGRFLILNDPKPSEIEAQVARALDPPSKTIRALHIDMDDVYDPSPEQVNENLGALLDRVKSMGVNTVYLQAFADPDADGTASSLYFPNRYLPMRADLFNRVTWQLKTRARVQVYAWLPLLAFDLSNHANTGALAVKVEGDDGEPMPTPHDYRRLSPFLPESLDIVSGIYEDLAKNMSGLNGVLIHDDAYLESDEDVSSCAPEARWPGNGQPIEDCSLSAGAKTQALIDFGQAVIGNMRTYRNVSNSFNVARNMYARVVMDPSSEVRFAQALGPFLRHYDYVALMAMPYLDGTNLPPERWLIDLEERVEETPGALNKVIFELQTRNWSDDEWIAGDTLQSWMNALIVRGALNLAYYPDDFLINQPPFEAVYPVMSLNSFPAKGRGSKP